jgi:site-specific DNA recombinase
MSKLAVKYRRISEDREGRELGIQRQDEDLDALGQQRDLTYIDSYADNDIGASSKSRKPRPDYQRMLADARAGRFQVIAAYTTGRITRRPREFEDLIDLAVEHGIEFVYVRSPEFDLRTAQGRRVARTLAAHDAGESEELSERVSRAARQRAEKGLNFGGRRCFGYAPDGAAIPAEFVVIRKMADDLLRGTPLGAIARELNSRPFVRLLLDNEHLLDAHPEDEREVFLLRHRDGLDVAEVARRVGLRQNSVARLLNNVLERQRKLSGPESKVPGWTSTVTGRPWTPGAVRDLLARPRLAGLSVYRGKVVGKGQWPAVLPLEQHHAIVALIRDPKRRTTTGNRAGYLLSGIATCARCGNSISSLGTKQTGKTARRALYRCRKRACVGVRRDWADTFVEEAVFERLSRPDAANLLVDQDRPDTEALQAEADAIRIRLDSAAGLFAQQLIDARQLTIITDELNGRLREIEAEQRHTSRAPLLADLIAAGDQVEAVWRLLTLDRRRAVVQALMEIRMHPGGQGKRELDPRKIEITLKE